MLTGLRHGAPTHSDEHGRAEIDQDKCVSCGMCLVSCPFSAIVDKGQIYQTVLALKSETPVYAIVAPAIAGQFEGLKNTQIRSAFQALGFTDIREVAVGADLCTIEEAKDFLKEVPEKLPFMATSCCPAWSMMAKKLFPQQAECISMGADPDGAHRPPYQAERTGLQDRICRPMRGEKTGGQPPHDPQLC